MSAIKKILMSFLHKVNKNVTPLKIIISKLKLNIIIYGGEKMNKKLKNDLLKDQPSLGCATVQLLN